MRSKRILLSKALVPFFLLASSKSTSAQEIGSSYFGVSGGAVFFNSNEIRDHDLGFDTGFVVSGLVGYIFGSVRAEAEVSYSRANLQFGISEEELTVLRGTANLHIDLIGLGSPNILPYVGGGLGVASLEFYDEIDDSDLGLTAHGELGISFAASSSFDVLFAYRFEHFETDISDAEKDFQSHQVRVGLRFF